MERGPKKRDEMTDEELIEAINQRHEETGGDWRRADYGSYFELARRNAGGDHDWLNEVPVPPEHED